VDARVAVEGIESARHAKVGNLDRPGSESLAPQKAPAPAVPIDQVTRPEGTTGFDSHSTNLSAFGVAPSRVGCRSTGLAQLARPEQLLLSVLSTEDTEDTGRYEYSGRSARPDARK
jgi:hypothetical protein